MLVKDSKMRFHSVQKHLQFFAFLCNYLFHQSSRAKIPSEYSHAGRYSIPLPSPHRDSLSRNLFLRGGLESIDDFAHPENRFAGLDIFGRLPDSSADEYWADAEYKEPDIFDFNALNELYLNVRKNASRNEIKSHPQGEIRFVFICFFRLLTNET